MVLAVVDLEVPFLAEETGQTDAIDVALLLDVELSEPRIDLRDVGGTVGTGHHESRRQGQVVAAQSVMDE